MKKFIFLILLILPIFLMITISFTGRIFSVFTYIEVEKVEFIDENGYEINEDNALKIAINENLQLYYKVFPDKAKNKTVSFSSTNPNICTVNGDGVVIGVNYGYSTIIIKTEENQKTDRVTIKVTNERVESVTISNETLSLPLYGQHQLVAVITPQTAVNKNVVWTSSDPSIVSVDYNGMVKALKTTDENAFVIITSRSVDNEDAFDTVKISVNEFAIAFKAELNGNAFTASPTQSLDLLNEISYNTSVINVADIRFEIISGVGEIQDGHILYFTNTSNSVSFIKIRAYVLNTTYSTTTTCYYQFN